MPCGIGRKRLKSPLYPGEEHSIPTFVRVVLPGQLPVRLQFHRKLLHILPSTTESSLKVQDTVLRISSVRKFSLLVRLLGVDNNMDCHAQIELYRKGLQIQSTCLISSAVAV